MLSKRDFMKPFTLLSLLISLACLIAPYSHAAEDKGQTKIQWFGHAAFKITTPKGHVLWIDPWLSNPLNPASKEKRNPLDDVQKADYILVTHGHSDHVGEAVEIAKKTKARLVAPYDLGQAMVKVLKFPADQVGFDTLGNPGGELSIADGEVKIIFTQAVHGSNLDVPDSDKSGAPAVYGGVAVGYVIVIKNGPTIYDSGDTAYFSDMKLIGRKFHPDLSIINIGGHFGMEVPDAIQAASDIHAKLTIPQHYQTFPILTATADEFLKGLKSKRLDVMAPKVLDVLTFSGTKFNK